MKSNHAADDRQLTRKSLINRGIEQACRRRISSRIHSGVRVKVRGKLSTSSEPRNSHAKDHMQSMLKRLWMESETSALTVDPSLKTTLGSALLRDVGIQTTSISCIDRQTSCELPSFTSQSETTRSDENSTQSERSSQETLSTSATSTSASEDEQVYASHRRNHNRNNNAVENVETNESVAVTCEPSDRSYKQRFLAPFFHLFSLLRLSSLRGDRPAGSRCRRSTARPRPLPPSVPCPEEQPSSIDFISNALVSMEQQQKQANNSSLPVNLALNSNRQPDRQRRKNKTQEKQRHPRRKVRRSEPKHQAIINEELAREENSLPGSLLVTESTPPTSPSTDIIHLRVKNKHLFPHFSLVSYPVEEHQMKIVQEFQSILQQTKQTNNNALEHDPSLPREQNLTTHSMKNHNAHHRLKTSVSSTSENPSSQDERSGFIQQGVQQLQRYQQLAQQYRFKSNPAVRQFLMKSVALSSDALHKLSTNNQKK